MTSVMPKPPAAFSPLTTTRSSFQSAISFGNRSVKIARPDRPTTSPINKMRMRGSASLQFPEIKYLALRSHEIEPRVAVSGGHVRNFLGGESDANRCDRLFGAQRID